MPDRMQVAGLLANAEHILKDNAIADPRLDARLLLQHILDVSHARLISMIDEHPSAEQVERYYKAVSRRSCGEPVHRILGKREFFGREFQLSEDTLVPRPETEILVEAVIELHNQRGTPARILEIGVGSGAISVSLACALRESTFVATDISEDALATAQNNASQYSVANRIEFVFSGLFENVTGLFDLIVSNPPYIPTKEIAKLDREVKDHDPRLALDGGANGLDFYRAIFDTGRNFLCENGAIVVEFGIGQASALRILASQCGLEVVNIRNDLSGIERVMELRRSS